VPVDDRRVARRAWMPMLRRKIRREGEERADEQRREGSARFEERHTHTRL
jgi:hypothetical protein